MGLISWTLVLQQNLCKLAGSSECLFSVKADVQLFGYSERHRLRLCMDDSR